MSIKPEDAAKLIYEKSLLLLDFSGKAKAAGETVLASETLAVSRTLMRVSLFLKTGELRELNVVAAPYQILVGSLQPPPEMPAPICSPGDFLDPGDGFSGGM